MSNPTVQQLIKFDSINKQLMGIQKQLSDTDAYKNIKINEQIAVNSLEACKSANYRAAELMDNFNSLSRQYEEVSKSYADITAVADECIDDTELNYYIKILNDLQRKIDQLIKQLEKINSEINEAAKSFKLNSDKYRTALKAKNENTIEFMKIKSEKEAEIIKLQEEMKPIRQSLPKDLVTVYDNFRKAKKWIILAEYVTSGKGNGSCQGCFMQVDSQTHENITKTGYEICPNCGRIMYIV